MTNQLTRVKAASVRVKRGARWLDENFPGWEGRINVKTLELSDGKKCICGQVFKKEGRKINDEGFSYAYRHLFGQANSWLCTIVGPTSRSPRRTESAAVAMGFMGGSLNSSYSWKVVKGTDAVHVSYGELTTAWKNLLAKRALDKQSQPDGRVRS